MAKVKVKKSKGPGRKKGSKNSNVPSLLSVKEEMLKVYQMLGGTKAFFKFIKESQTNKRMFYAMFSKMLPKEISFSNPGDSPTELPFTLKIEGKAPDGSNGNPKK